MISTFRRGHSLSLTKTITGSVKALGIGLESNILVLLVGLLLASWEVHLIVI